MNKAAKPKRHAKVLYLHDWLKAREYPVKHFAEVVGKERSHLYKIMTGKNSYDDEFLLECATRLELPVWALFMDVETFAFIVGQVRATKPTQIQSVVENLAKQLKSRT